MPACRSKRNQVGPALQIDTSARPHVPTWRGAPCRLVQEALEPRLLLPLVEVRVEDAVLEREGAVPRADDLAAVGRAVLGHGLPLPRRRTFHSVRLVRSGTAPRSREPFSGVRMVR